MERSAIEGGSSSSGGAGNEGVYGLGVSRRQTTQWTGPWEEQGRRRPWERAGPVGRSGAGRRMTNNLNFIGQEATAGTEVVTIKLRGTESSVLIAAVLGWNSTTQ